MRKKAIRALGTARPRTKLIVSEVCILEIMDCGYADINALGVSEFCEWISDFPDHDFSETVVRELRANGIDGCVFMLLTADELKEMAPRLADRVALREIQSAVRPLCARWKTMCENTRCDNMTRMSQGHTT